MVCCFHLVPMCFHFSGRLLGGGTTGLSANFMSDFLRNSATVFPSCLQCLRFDWETFAVTLEGASVGLQRRRRALWGMRVVHTPKRASNKALHTENEEPFHMLRFCNRRFHQEWIKKTGGGGWGGNTIQKVPKSKT